MNYYSDTYSKHSKNFILSLATNDFEPMISNDFIKVLQRVANNQFIYKMTSLQKFVILPMILGVSSI